jgi:hypothetical protein
VSVIRRQFFFLCVVGCAVSLGAEGRVTPWLVFDASVSAAFMPACQLLGFFVVWRARPLWGRAERSDVHAFLDGNAAWLWWWCAAAATAAFVPPRSLSPWLALLPLSALLPFVWSVIADVRWLRGEGRTPRQAAADVCALRTVTWGAGIAWFFGIAIWYGEVPKLAAWWRA